MPREPGPARALPVALALMGQARAWKHDKDLSNRLTDQAAGLAEAGDVEIAIVILIRDHEYACEDGMARRVREDPAARPADPVNLTGEMRAMGSCSRRTDRWRSRSPIT